MICPKCGTANGPNSKFCGNCGILLTGIPSPPKQNLTTPQPPDFYNVPLPLSQLNKSSYTSYFLSGALGSALFILTMFLIGSVSNALNFTKIQSEIFAVLSLIIGQFIIGIIVTWHKYQRFFYSLVAAIIPIIFMLIYIIATKREIIIIIILIPFILGPTYLGALFGKLFHHPKSLPVPVPSSIENIT